MKHRITPNDITELKPNEIFVFGSNEAGRHGKGAAKTALTKFGAIYNRGYGFQGQCFAIPTKSVTLRTLSLIKIRSYVSEFIMIAKSHPDKTFLVTEIGCGLAGFKPEEIAPMFKDAVDVENIHLPKSFWNILVK